ncbi:MAG: HAMP domain-containing sensor histidine kinase [Pirellulales bacterium]
MITRRSLGLPIGLAVVMIVLLITLTIVWVVMLVQSANWALLSVGAVFFALVLVGVVIYLTLSIKAINLNQRQSNFIDSVTHELKSPIASLKLYLQTLTRRPVTPDEQQHFYRAMLEDVERLDQLINHLLDAARIEKHSMGAEPEVLIDLPQLLREVARSVCQVHQRPVDSLQFDLRPAQAVARRVDITLVFRNLIDNAIKYAGEPPQVTISTWTERNHSVVRIVDNGRGVPAHLRNKVFGRFVRLGRELERDKPGTGLGLYIVYTLVRRLRGQIRLTSGPDGTGTAVVVKLPRPATIDEPEAKLTQAASPQLSIQPAPAGS